jgi:dihydrodipicolinate reductase
MEDGIEIFPTSQRVYLADLNLGLVAGKRDHAGLLLVRGGDVWLKNVSFTGDGNSCRAIDMSGSARLFMSGAPVSRSYVNEESKRLGDVEGP